MSNYLSLGIPFFQIRSHLLVCRSPTSLEWTSGRKEGRRGVLLDFFEIRVDLQVFWFLYRRLLGVDGFFAPSSTVPDPARKYSMDRLKGLRDRSVVRALSPRGPVPSDGPRRAAAEESRSEVLGLPCGRDVFRASWILVASLVLGGEELSDDSSFDRFFRRACLSALSHLPGGRDPKSSRSRVLDCHPLSDGSRAGRRDVFSESHRSRSLFRNEYRSVRMDLLWMAVRFLALLAFFRFRRYRSDHASGSRSSDLAGAPRGDSRGGRGRFSSSHLSRVWRPSEVLLRSSSDGVGG